MAAKYGFDAVNLDVDFALKEGPEAVRQLLHENNLKPAAFRFPVKITDEAEFISEGKKEILFNLLNFKENFKEDLISSDPRQGCVLLQVFTGQPCTFFPGASLVGVDSCSKLIL